MRCLKRFSARRGVPAKFISDNGKTFKAAAKYLKTVFKDGKGKKYPLNLETDWIFNVEHAPCWGGAFGRMVKSTKRCLRKLIGRAHFFFDELVTVLAEIECVINSRPLMYVSSGDTEKPLTPSHLLVGRWLHNLPDHLGWWPWGWRILTELYSAYPPIEIPGQCHQSFWNCWRCKYLSELRESHSHTARQQPNTKPSNVSVGEVMIVHDEHLPCGLWKLGRIETVMKGCDDRIRGVTVKMAGEDGWRVVLSQPIQLLYPLEIRAQDSPSETDVTENSGEKTKSSTQTNPDEPTETQTPKRPRWAAAQWADVRRRACTF